MTTMIDDLQDKSTDAHILLIAAEHIDSITTLLKSNNYQNIQCCDNVITAKEQYDKFSPDLVIISPIENLTASELSKKLETFCSDDNLPPVILINEDKDTTPAIDKVVKDFINLPINEDTFLFRIHHLLTDYLSLKELNTYNKSIINAIQQRSQELKDSQTEIIECLGYAAEFRDSETGMHTLRVGHYAQCLAKAMGMNDKEAESLLYSAPMHDVGKIGIPDKILLKPGPLEDNEWDIMRSHTTIGEKILNRSSNKLLHQASIIALNHHEKWNGTGYPRGLEETDIHLYGRIVAIVDVFDALTMDRPYKKAWTIDKTVELINSESGQHFDPTLVDLFNANLKEIIKIKIAYTDRPAEKIFLNEYISR